MEYLVYITLTIWSMFEIKSGKTFFRSKLNFKNYLRFQINSNGFSRDRFFGHSEVPEWIFLGLKIFYNRQKWLSSEFWIRNCFNSFSFLKRNETAKIKGLQKQSFNECIDIRDNFALFNLSLQKWITWNVYIGENVSDQKINANPKLFKVLKTNILFDLQLYLEQSY